MKIYLRFIISRILLLLLLQDTSFAALEARWLGLHGQIRILDVEYYEEFNRSYSEWEPEITILKLTKYFDDLGRMTKFITYNQDGSPFGSVVFTLDTYGNTIEEAHYTPDGKLLRAWKTIIIYDTQGNIQESSSYNPDGTLKEKIEYIYSVNRNNTIEKIYYTSQGSRSSSFIQSYNEQGNPLEEVSYDKDGNLVKKREYSYDEQGHQTEVRHYDAQEKIIEKREYSYDKNGYQTESRHYRENALVSHSIHIYNTDGKKVKIVYRDESTQRLATETVEMYDDYENVISRTRYVGDGVVIGQEEITYEYDEHQNWIKRIETKKVSRYGELVLTFKRITSQTITYR